MTTDITELAQSLKAAAVRAKTATEEYASGHMSVSVCYAECEEFNRLTDGPDNILALVEALEHYKSREERVTSLVRNNSKSWDELYRQVEAKGKRNVELVEALEKAQETIAFQQGEIKALLSSLESRTVTVKLPPKIERNDADGWFMYNCGRVGGGAAEWYNKALDDVGVELTAAGIKVEAE
ncbi:TPA: ead/Ea22-like family protein [Klebsiella quasipneumoniae]